MPQFFLIATQRSGTHFFKSLLNCHPMVRATGEILLAGTNHPGSYGTWAERKQVNGFEAFTHFLRAAEARSPKKSVIFDIKYNQFRLMEKESGARQSKPSLVEWWEKQNSSILKLQRENKLRVYISRQRARETQQYHVVGADVVKRRNIHLRCEHLIGELDKIVLEEAQVSRWLEGLNVFLVHYEKLAEGCDAELQAAWKFLGLPAPKYPVVAATKKISPETLASGIVNWDQVVKALTSTQYERFLSDEV